jgi:hypothetical protein
MQTGNPSPRQVGVKIPTGQIYDKSNQPALTVVGLVELKFYAVEYVDRKGNKVPMLVMKSAAGEMYEAPNGSAWLNDAKMLSDQMKKNVEAVLATAPRAGGSVADTVPTEDTVDVLATEVAAPDPAPAPVAAEAQ